MQRQTSRQATVPLLPAHSRYLLDVADLTAPVDVLRFKGEEALSECYSYKIEFTSPEQDIDPKHILNKDTFLLMQLPPKRLSRWETPKPEQPLRRVHGIITHFERLSDSRDEARYRVTLEPRLALLRHSHRYAIYQNLSVPQVIDQILRQEHDLQGQHFWINLDREYPKRELVVRWGESALDFIRRIAAEVGIWFRFEVDERLEIEVVHFGDTQRTYSFDHQLPHVHPSGMNDEGTASAWDIKTGHAVVPKRVEVRDYNYREAARLIEGEAHTVNDDPTTYGVPYHFREDNVLLEAGDAYDAMDKVESSAFHARLHHERYLNEQNTIRGESTSPTLMPGQVLTLQGGAPKITEDGIIITQIQCYGSRADSYIVKFQGIPYSEYLGYRPKLLKKPVIAGTVPARVSSTRVNDEYSHIDAMGRYRIHFMFDKAEWKKGLESLWVRLAKPYAGETYGFHWPLLDGTEVAIAFEGGDPDRPYIAYALHDSRHPDHVTIENYRRNVLRTPTNNKLRMEDHRGREHIKLSTEYGGKSQLNLGHLVDSQRKPRGEGFELRTDEWGAIRGGKGLLLTASQKPVISTAQLDMDEIKQQLSNALSLAESLSNLLQTAQIAPLETGSQQSFLRTVDGLQQPVIVAGAPEGVVLSTPQHIQQSADGNILMTAGGNHEMSSLKRMILSAKKAMVVFVHELGMKLVAAAGKIQIQAQSDAIEITAVKDIRITSTADEIVISADKKITLQCGGSFLTLEPGKIEHGTQGDFNVKSANFNYSGAASLSMSYPGFRVCDNALAEAAAQGDAIVPLT